MDSFQRIRADVLRNCDPFSHDTIKSMLKSAPSYFSHQKILRESNYWDDVFLIFNGRKVHLYLTGPEMSGQDGVFKTGRKEGKEDVRTEANKTVYLCIVVIRNSSYLSSTLNVAWYMSTKIPR